MNNVADASATIRFGFGRSGLGRRRSRCC